MLEHGPPAREGVDEDVPQENGLAAQLGDVAVGHGGELVLCRDGLEQGMSQDAGTM